MSAVFENQASVAKVSEVKTLILDHNLIKFGPLVYRHNGIIKVQYEAVKPPKSKEKSAKEQAAKGKTDAQGQYWWLLIFPFAGIALSGEYIGLLETWNSSVLGWLIIIVVSIIVLALLRPTAPAQPTKKKPKEEARLHIHLSVGDKFVFTGSVQVIALMQKHIEQFMAGTNEHQYVAIDTKTGAVQTK